MFLKKSGTGTYFTMVNNVSISRKKLIFIILIITESSKLSSIAKMSKAMLPKPCLKLFKVRKYIFVKSTLLYLFTFFFVKSTIICQKNFREINYVFFSAPACHENMVKVGGYILGEFGNLIAGDARSAPLVQFRLLHSKYHLCSQGNVFS